MNGALDDLADTAWEYASDNELLTALTDIETMSRQLYAITLAVTAQVDIRGIASARGVTSTAVLLRQLLRITPGVAHRRLADARQVCPRVAVTGEVLEPELPVAGSALRAGVIGEQHLQVVRQTVEQLPSEVDHEVRDAVESRLVGEAEGMDPVQLNKLAYRIRAHLDPDGSAEGERRAVDRRELTFSPDLHGTVLLRGRLDAEGAATVQAALAPLAAPRPADTHGHPDRRSPARRRADALVDAARILLHTNHLPTQNGGQRPHLTVTIPLTDLTSRITPTTDNEATATTATGTTATGTTAVGTTATGTTATGTTGTADLDNGSIITAAAARRIACDASVVPIVLGGNSEPLDVGRATYAVPAPMRRALIARDRGCAFPDCDRPPSWCEVHHIIHWADGGPTALTNLTLLCDYHHRVVHDQEWHVRVVNGHPEFIPPEWLDPNRTPLRNTMHNPPPDHPTRHPARIPRDHRTRAAPTRRSRQFVQPTSRDGSSTQRRHPAPMIRQAEGQVGV